MDRDLTAWCAFGAYILLTTVLALRGMKKTKDFSGFALGNGDLGPVIVGITLAASIASTATFVINPGFVYTHGVSALMHLGIAASLGVIVALVVFSKGFRALGKESAALTLPHWIGARFGLPHMRTYFALLNLLLAVSFVVLIVKGSALVMQHTLGLGYVASVVVIVVFVFSYILLGGTYAHVYTNAFQGALMVVVALVIVGSGLYLLGDGVGPFFDRLAEQDAQLVAPVNEASPLFGSWWDVFVCGFVVGAGLTCQPHILTKSLYLSNEKDLRRFLVVASIIGVVFAAVLVAGLYARIRFPGIEVQDTVMPIYLTRAFGPVTGVLISVALLAAGMSTLDGLLVGASTIAANDLVLGKLGDRFFEKETAKDRQKIALSASRWILVVMGLVSGALALDPPDLVGIFAQVGVYGLVSASLAPVALGVLVKDLDSRAVFAAAIVGPLVHFTHYLVSVYGFDTFVNPASTATEGVLASFAVLGVLEAVRRFRRQSTLVVGTAR
ncbi:MAG: sodium:solute symporter family protein [Myxococcales bacterium]|nr:sodium:solute symporter family protein [Myxococcales bacterium]